MAKSLRKELTNYGDTGFFLFLRTAFSNAAVYSDSALDRQIEKFARSAAAGYLLPLRSLSCTEHEAKPG
jgi:dihydroxy-acid dehydratase